MAERQFQDGDVVVLKSGGEPMTVEGWNEQRNQYTCVWFDKKKSLRDTFGAAVLTRYDPPAPFELFSVG